MNFGYVFICNSASFRECLRNKAFSCSTETVNVAEDIEIGAIVFLLNKDTNKLIGPFTVTGSLHNPLEPGTWASTIDKSSFSENVKLEWEELHALENAQERLPFLKNVASCRLSPLQIQDLLNVLKQAAHITSIEDFLDSEKVR
jgi:hypothetical protein